MDPVTKNPPLPDVLPDSPLTILPATRPYRYRIDGLQKALRMAERLKIRDVFNWAEILRSAEEIIKNAPKDAASQEAARKRYLEVLADMDADDLPAALRPIVGSAAAILEGEDEREP